MVRGFGMVRVGEVEGLTVRSLYNSKVRRVPLHQAGVIGTQEGYTDLLIL